MANLALSALERRIGKDREPAKANGGGASAAASFSGVFASPAFRGHEEVAFFHDEASGLRAIIAVHSTRLGPALGGCRMWPYASDVEAITDVLRLSHAMTYKNAMAQLLRGGGKSVIIGDPQRDKSEDLFHAFGRCVESLGGRYVVAEDVGTAVEDMTVVRSETRHVMGFAAEAGSSGDPSPVTAYGVFCGLKAAVKFRLGRDNLEGVAVAVQGLGHVGYHLCEFLHEAGARLFVADIDPAAIERVTKAFGAVPVGTDQIYDLSVDVYAPCALGATLNDETIPRLKAAVVAGAANNQLATAEDGAALAARDILYAPDYVINAGGVINLAYENGAYDRQKAMAHTGRIYDTAMEIFERARLEGLPTSVVADNIAEERLAAGH